MTYQWRSSRRLFMTAIGVAVGGLMRPAIGLALDLDVSGSVPLTEAAAQGNLQKVHDLIISGTSPNLTDSSGRPAIGWAAFEGHTAIVEELLKAPRILPNAKDAQGNTALMLAAERGHADTVETLIGGNVNLDLDNRDGMTALMLAAQNGRLPVVMALVKAGADVTIEDDTGRTALDWAKDSDRQQVIDVLQRASSKKS